LKLSNDGIKDLVDLAWYGDTYALQKLHEIFKPLLDKLVTSEFPYSKHTDALKKKAKELLDIGIARSMTAPHNYCNTRDYILKYVHTKLIRFAVHLDAGDKQITEAEWFTKQRQLTKVADSEKRDIKEACSMEDAAVVDAASLWILAGKRVLSIAGFMCINDDVNIRQVEGNLKRMGFVGQLEDVTSSLKEESKDDIK